MRDQCASFADGVGCARVEPIGFKDPIDVLALLKRGNGFAHGAAVRRQDTAPPVRDPNLMQAIHGIDDLDVIAKKIRQAHIFVEVAGKGLELWPNQPAELLRLLIEASIKNLRCELIRSVVVLLEVVSTLKCSQHSE